MGHKQTVQTKIGCHRTFGLNGLMRVLRSKMRALEQMFENGDTVFYKREGKDRWLS